jgi:4-hydroxy-tetrahydrodipicolinate synthase
MFMNKPFFSGTCTALVTPFLDDKVNYPMLEQLIKRQIMAGINAVVISGTTGEASTLSDNEKLEMFIRAKICADNECKIIAGTGSNHTAHAVALSADAQEAGADALLIVTPYYNKATPAGLISHYSAIAQAVTIPIIVYNVPSRTGVDIPVHVYETLSHIPNIIGVKEASTDIVKISRIRNACGPNFSIWTGNDDQAVPAISLGAQGVISVASNVFPEKTNEMTLAALDGDLDTASHLQRELLPLIDMLFCEVNPIPVKQAMKLLGYDCGGCRLPLTALSPQRSKEMVQLLSKQLSIT